MPISSGYYERVWLYVHDDDTAAHRYRAPLEQHVEEKKSTRHRHYYFLLTTYWKLRQSSDFLFRTEQVDFILNWLLMYWFKKLKCYLKPFTIIGSNQILFNIVWKSKMFWFENCGRETKGFLVTRICWSCIHKTSNMELQFVIGVPWWQNFGETHLRSSADLSSEHKFELDMIFWMMISQLGSRYFGRDNQYSRLSNKKSSIMWF